MTTQKLLTFGPLAAALMLGGCATYRAAPPRYAYFKVPCETPGAVRAVPITAPAGSPDSPTTSPAPSPTAAPPSPASAAANDAAPLPSLSALPARDGDCVVAVQDGRAARYGARNYRSGYGFYGPALYGGLGLGFGYGSRHGASHHRSHGGGHHGGHRGHR